MVWVHIFWSFITMCRKSVYINSCWLLYFIVLKFFTLLFSNYRLIEKNHTYDHRSTNYQKNWYFRVNPINVCKLFKLLNVRALLFARSFYFLFYSRKGTLLCFPQQIRPYFSNFWSISKTVSFPFVFSHIFYEKTYFPKNIYSINGYQ